MKVSLNWVKDYTKVELPIDKLEEKIGAQLGAIEEVSRPGELYAGIVIAKVVSCEKHPNADRLFVCRVDDRGVVKDIKRDNQGFVQVVCGAPNVREGILVAWLPPGTTVPSTIGKEPLVLEARDIRGETSNGMLASPKELGISDNHDGLLEIDETAQPGQSFAEIYQLDDVIFDIENKMFTHRPDCFGQLGVAREIAGITGQQFTSPEWYKNVISNVFMLDAEQLPLHVVNEVPNLVPRFMAIPLRNVTIKPSPTWLQSYLSRLGIRPINNVVDVTNYMMLLTAQPLHAYDYDKVRRLDEGADQATLTVRLPKENEKITLLNGKVIEPRKDAIMIATAQKLIGLGGVMGGTDTEVDENTKSIILECATFDMYSIRRTAMEHGIFTEAVTRFTKGQSPFQNDRVLAKSIELLGEIADTKVAGKAVDSNHASTVAKIVQVSEQFINERLGLTLTGAQIKTLLQNVEFQVEGSNGSFSITPPFWRTDIEIPEDIVEEVGRLYGYDHLSLELPKRDITPMRQEPLLEAKARVRDALSKLGANEVLTYTFVNGNLLDKVGQDKLQAFQLGNALSPNLQYYRLSLTPSLLEKVHPNIKAGFNEMTLFEINKVHNKVEVDEAKLPKEFNRVALVFVADDATARARYVGAPYYQARKYAEVLLGKSKPVSFVPLTEKVFEDHEAFKQMIAPFAADRAALVFVNNHLAGIVGEYKASVRTQLKVPDYTAGFELFMSIFVQDQTTVYTPLPRFPKVEQDICLKVSSDLSFHELFDFVKQQLNNELKSENIHFTLSPVDIYQRQEDKKHRQITFRLAIASYVKTMTDAEVNTLLDHVAKATQEKYNAVRI